MKSSKIMYLYAAFLAACGFAAFAMADFDWAKAKTGLIIPLATAIVIFICGAMAGKLQRNRTVGMIGIHVGMVLPLSFAGVFGWRSFKTFSSGVAEKQYLAVILAVMAAGSLVAFVAILLTRPKKADRES